MEDPRMMNHIHPSHQTMSWIISYQFYKNCYLWVCCFWKQNELFQVTKSACKNTKHPVSLGNYGLQQWLLLGCLQWTEAICNVILEAFLKKLERGLKMQVHSHTRIYTHVIRQP